MNRKVRAQEVEVFNICAVFKPEGCAVFYVSINASRVGEPNLGDPH